jgi:hypothetical protein
MINFLNFKLDLFFIDRVILLPIGDAILQSSVSGLQSPFVPKVCRFRYLDKIGRKVPFWGLWSGFRLQRILEEGRQNIPASNQFCSVADENVRQAKFTFSANPVLESPEAIFRMAQPLAQDRQA